MALILENFDITNIFFADQIQKKPIALSPLMESKLEQIQKYFKGERLEFNLLIQMKGKDFLIKIWKLLFWDPYTTSLAYENLDQEYGDAKIVRAITFVIAKKIFS